jgi:hypothetical protein
MFMSYGVEEFRSLGVNKLQHRNSLSLPARIFLFYNTSPCHFYDYLKGTIISGNVLASTPVYNYVI